MKKFFDAKVVKVWILMKKRRNPFFYRKKLKSFATCIVEMSHVLVGDARYRMNMIDANVLVEALPYVKEYTNQIVVVKYGGNAMIDEQLKAAVIKDVTLLNLLGVHVVLVHGGGPEINEMLEKTNKESKFLNGLRVTDDETMDIVQMVLCGKVNKNLVNLLDRGIGLSGVDGSLFEIILDTFEKGYIPVVSSVAKAIDKQGTYNINADLAASELAIALHAKKLILLTDVKGLMKDPKDESTLMERVKVSQIPLLKKEKVITGGMIPKIECCVKAVREGVESVNIQDGRVMHSLLVELLSNQGVGTLIE